MTILFNKTLEQCRQLGARGGRAHARNLRLRTSQAQHPSLAPLPERPLETAHQASSCLSGCLSKPQLVVWGGAQAAVPQEPPRVPSAVRHRASLPAVLGHVPVAGWVRVPALRP